MEPGWTQALAVLSQIAMGCSLAATAGLRAFLPLFAVGLAGRLEWIPLGDGFAWLAATPALVVFGAAVVVELVADKVPLVDHALDAVQTFVKPVAGVVAAAAVLADLSPLQTTVLAIVLGGGIATGVHAVKANARALSTVTTAGFANPLISLLEEFGAWGLVLLALVVPLLTVLLLALLLPWAWRRLVVRGEVRG